jgi:hypothetical protein
MPLLSLLLSHLSASDPPASNDSETTNPQPPDPDPSDPPSDTSDQNDLSDRQKKKLRIQKPLATAAPPPEEIDSTSEAPEPPNGLNPEEEKILKQLADLTRRRKLLMANRQRRQLSEKEYEARVSRLNIESSRLRSELQALREGENLEKGGEVSERLIIAQTVAGGRRVGKRARGYISVVLSAGVVAVIVLAVAVNNVICKRFKQERSDRLPSALDRARR